VQEVPTTQVKKGTFTEELTEEGTIRAVNSMAINAPAISYRYGSLKISKMVDDGKEVEAGDTVIVFDPSEIRKAIINAQQQLEIARAEYDKLKATQESEIEDLEADLEIARINQQISKINFDQAVFESEITRKEINLKLETANISLDRAREQIDNKKKIHQEELFQKGLAIKQLEVTLDDANRSVNSLFVISPSRGIAILKENWMSGRKWQIGDQPYGMTPLIDLPDMSQMKAEIKINEVDVSKVVPGLRTIIKADAYSDTTYLGTVTKIANLARKKDYNSKIKIFPAEILITGEPTRLLPGLTVSCRILVREIPDVLYVPVEAVIKSQGVEYVYVRDGAGFKKQEVRVGALNTDFAVIEEGVAENDEVALKDPYLNKQEETNGSKTK
jgi:multidrug efflux pump subunit AcrA (membrane-fusion protein)